MDINNIVGLCFFCFALFTLSGLILILCGMLIYSQKQNELLDKKDELEKLSLERKQRYEMNVAYCKLIDNLQNKTNKKNKK